MSTKHLTTGSSCPPLAAGVLRLYSMKFCSYAERTRLVLNAKGVSYEIVNINTYKKPEWYKDKNPSETTPTIEMDGKIVCESIITSDYVDDMFPEERPMYPTDPYKKAKDKMFINYFDTKVFGKDGALFKAYLAQGADTDNLLKELDNTEADLKKRDTNFFGGILPNMVDYMIWPAFVLMFGLPFKVLGVGEDLPDSLPVLKAWRQRMLEDPAVKSIHLPNRAIEEFWSNYRKPTSKFDEIDCE